MTKTATYIPLSHRSVAELRARADEYRIMAATERTGGTKKSLLKLADRLDALAMQRGKGGEHEPEPGNFRCWMAALAATDARRIALGSAAERERPRCSGGIVPS